MCSYTQKISCLIPWYSPIWCHLCRSRDRDPGLRLSPRFHCWVAMTWCRLRWDFTFDRSFPNWGINLWRFWVLGDLLKCTGIERKIDMNDMIYLDKFVKDRSLPLIYPTYSQGIWMNLPIGCRAFNRQSPLKQVIFHEMYNI